MLRHSKHFIRSSDAHIFFPSSISQRGSSAAVCHWVHQRRIHGRPSNAPKAFPDIAHIRRNPGLYEQNCEERNYRHFSKHAWKIVELWEEQAKIRVEAHPLREKSNAYNARLKQVVAGTKGQKTGNDIARLKVKLLSEAKAVKEQLSSLIAKEKKLQEEMDKLALELPNLSDSSHTGTDLQVLEYIGDPEKVSTNAGEAKQRLSQSDAPKRNETARTRVLARDSNGSSTPLLHHLDIGSHLGIIDLPAAATASGWGWYYLVGAGALLEQALVQHAISVCTAYGWRLVSPPTIVYDHIANACGFHPRDQNNEAQIYAIEEEARVLAGTAEIPLAAMKANTVFGANELPLKTVGVSRCYRAEAGARGVDTRGLYRVHEFTKVEMFGWALPDGYGTDSHGTGNFDTTSAQRLAHSAELFDEIVRLQKAILEPLGLHCRILSMPSSDLGASASRKVDIEAFFPSRAAAGKNGGWGELTSVSNCTDYQSRRLDTRVKGAEGVKSEFVHTVNGTALAVPRVIAALLENGWDASSNVVRLPHCLKPWMGGQDVIRREGL